MSNTSHATLSPRRLRLICIHQRVCARRWNRAGRLLVGVLLCAAFCVRPARGEVSIEVSEIAPRYVLDIPIGPNERDLIVRVHPRVRSLSVRVVATVSKSAPEARRIAAELRDRPKETSSRRESVIFRAVVSGIPDEGEGLFRLRESRIILAPRSHVLDWELKLRPADNSREASTGPTIVSITFDADVRPITDRERELMSWRETIDPVLQPDAIRTRIAAMTDEEVRYYTGFKDRENFLALWQKVRVEDQPRNDRGRVVIDQDNIGLFVPGHPLPNGKYVHH